MRKILLIKKDLWFGGVDRHDGAINIGNFCGRPELSLRVKGAYGQKFMTTEVQDGCGGRVEGWW